MDSGTLLPRWTPKGVLDNELGGETMKSTSPKWRLAAVAVVLVLIAAAAAYFLTQPLDSPVQQPGQPHRAAEPEPAKPEAKGEIESPIRHPIEQIPVQSEDAVVPATPLPVLNESDGQIGNALAELLGSGPVGELLMVRDFIRRVVVMVDNLPGERLPMMRSPLRPAQGSFVVERGGDGLVIGAANAARYAPYVHLAEAVDSGRLVAFYVRFYPLFQAAYEELGYPSAYFNDRLIAVIDHLLATPQVQGPLRLTQPKVRYVFEDTALESLSAGQKILLRMGPDNAARIKAKLGDLRGRLAVAVAK